MASQCGKQRSNEGQRQWRTPVGDTGFLLAKRCVDVMLSAVGLLLVCPLLAACAIWVRVVDPGPAMYRQWRVGQNGWLFRIRKLRTMYLHAESEDGPQFATSGDTRVLPGCAWMRKSHVDELPQLWNILIGEMSLVGPRPERPEMIERLRATLPRIEQRLECTPGLTGLAQVRNGYTNDPPGHRRKLAYDLIYMRNRNPWTELRLLLQTIPKVWDSAAM